MIRILEAADNVPWSGHTAHYAISEIYDAIAAHRLTLVFVNTRMQAEYVFQELWRANDEIARRSALHHGSLAAAQRKKVEAAMADGKLQGPWSRPRPWISASTGATSTRRPRRRAEGREPPHRSASAAPITGWMNPREALLVPGNRFEVLECRAALQAAEEGAQDAVLSRSGGLDVLAQHVLGMACAGTHRTRRVSSTKCARRCPMLRSTVRSFDRVVDFVATGGYALKAYDRFAKLRPTDDGRLRVARPAHRPAIPLECRHHVGTPMLKIRLVSERRRQLAKSGNVQGGRVLGEVEEDFVEQLAPGDTFVFAGEVLRFAGLAGNRGLRHARNRPRPDDPELCGGQVSAFNASRRTRPRHAR